MRRDTNGRQITKSLSKLTIAIRIVKEDGKLVSQLVTMMTRKMETVTRRRTFPLSPCSTKLEP